MMPSTWGHVVFFMFAPKQLYAALVSRKTTSVAIHCCLPELIPQSRGKIKMNEGVAACGPNWCTSRAGPVFLLFRYTPSQLRASLLTSPKKLKNPHLFYSYGRSPGKHSVAVKQFKRERRFRLLHHIHHILVDDGALFTFSPSGTDTTSVH